MKILQIAAYAAPYEGNFMSSLYALEKAMNKKGFETVYAFPETASTMQWCKHLAQSKKVYFLPLAKSTFRFKTYWILRMIFRDNPDITIAHSHFEQYDTPVALTAPARVKVFWHLHDPIVYRCSLRGVLMRVHYGLISRRAVLLSVAEKYRKDIIRLGFNEDNAFTVLNGIDLNRVRFKGTPRCNHQYCFLTFGWDFYRKGDDLILKACERLSAEGYNFKLLLNGGDSTWKALDDFYKGDIPDYVVKTQPTEDINSMFNDADSFIQASRRETFSYSVCEAAYAGLPVICSDIPGVEWAHSIKLVEFFKSEDWLELYNKMKELVIGKKIMPNANAVCETRKLIEDYYSVDCWVRNIISFYKL